MCLLRNEPTSLLYVAYISSVRSVCLVKARVKSPHDTIIAVYAAAIFVKLFKLAELIKSYKL